MFIDKYYIIQLKQPNRQKNVNGQIIAHSLSNYIIWDAINTKNIGIIPTLRFTTGMFGCYLSHTQIWKEAIRNNYSKIIVIEDDCSLQLNFTKKLNNVLESLPSDYDFALIGNYIHVGATINNINDYWCKCNNWYGTHCYLINLETMKEKIELFDVMTNQIDLQIRDLTNTKKLNSYLLREPIAQQIGLPTTVQKQKNYV